jgi:hypothetical protein
MSESCGKHSHERGVAICGRCGGAWCSSCIVYAFGPKKPPYCMSCAMVAGGVRTSATLPAMPRKQLKARMKAFRKDPDGPQAPEGPEIDVDPDIDLEPERESELVEAHSASDWSSPWWEDRQPTLAD